jgi:hypothetical protein
MGQPRRRPLPSRPPGREILLPIALAGETVTVGSAGIRAAVPGGAYEPVCDLADAGSHKVPADIRALAERIARTVDGADLQELSLSPMARALLDALGDIVKAQAREDEAALAEAMEAGRELVLTYRPSHKALLPPVSKGPAL